MARDRSIDLARDQVLFCEQRIALSVSVFGDLLLDGLDVAPSLPSTLHPQDTDLNVEPSAQESLPRAVSTQTGASQTPSVLEQAADLRQSNSLDGSDQTIAVIDTGIAWNHIALGGGFGPGYRVVGGWDFAENDALPYDDGPAGYHGTHVAGLLAGQSKDLTGIAPGADLVALRVFDDNGAGKLQWIESALQWVHDHQDDFESPITTVNLSVGALLNAENRVEAEEMLADELKQLREDNILVFAAAGNSFAEPGGGQLLYPASDPHVVAVSSANTDGELSEFAEREAGILAARGEAIRSAVPEHVFGWDGDYDDLANLDGTSMAAPQAAAASVLIRQALIQQGVQPDAEMILQQMHGAAAARVDLATGETYGLVDLQRAIESSADSGGNRDSGSAVQLDHFIGNHQSQALRLDLRDGITLHDGQQSFRLSPNELGEPILIDGAAGGDSLEIIGSTQAERLLLHSGDSAESMLNTNDFEIQLRGFEQVSFAGGGGRDRATLYDSSGDDSLTSKPESTTFTGVGFQFHVSGVPRIYVHATGGGSDSAFLHDSAEQETLAVRPQFTSLKSDSFFRAAFGFENVYAYSNAGGNDSAQLYDSASDDTMSVSLDRSMISSADYRISARGFSSVVAHATAGGDDIVRLYADEAFTRWDATADMVQWTSQHGARQIARGFERVEAFELFEPVDLSTRVKGLEAAWAFLHRDDRIEQESAATRQVFDALGETL